MLACVLTAGWGADFTTFIGDSNDYRVAKVVVDAAGNSFVGGTRNSEAFAIKLDGAGKAVLFATLSGKGVDQANDLAVDAAGSIYLAGATSSTLLPLKSALQAAPGPGFIVKFSADATQILWCTYFPAPVAAMAIDSAGNVYVTGVTNLPSFPVTAGLPAGTVTPFNTIASASGAFVTKIAATGDRVVYSALIAGHQKNCGGGSSCFLSSRYTAGNAIAVDSAGNAYFAGNTETADLPVTSGGFQATGTGAFVGKVNATGSALVYLSYVGPGYDAITPFTNPLNFVSGIAADTAGNAYLSGSTSDPAFPGKAAGGADGFAAKINASGSAMLWGARIGGSADDRAAAIAVDAAGNVWIAGLTTSSDFPNQAGWSQGSDFAVELDAAGKNVLYSSRFPNGVAGASIAIDGSGVLHLAGPTGLVSTITASATLAPRIFAIANAAGGGATGRLAPGEVFSIYGPRIGAGAATHVTINGSAVPVLYAGDSQINAVAPQSLAGPAELRVGGAVFTAVVINADPQIFPVILNQEGSINSADNPARVGSVASVWATGLGTGGEIGCCDLQAGGPLHILYGGPAPGAPPGVVQINFEVPGVWFGGDSLTLNLIVRGRVSETVTLWVATPGIR